MRKPRTLLSCLFRKHELTSPFPSFLTFHKIAATVVAIFPPIIAWFWMEDYELGDVQNVKDGKGLESVRLDVVLCLLLSPSLTLFRFEPVFIRSGVKRQDGLVDGETAEDHRKRMGVVGQQ